MSRTLLIATVLFLSACAHAATDTSPSAKATQSSIGYPSVNAALADLKSQSGSVVSVQQGWTIISNPANLTLWSFAPTDHPAYPAVIKRTSVERDGTVYMEMQSLCQADKESCDALIEQFKQLNEQMREYIKDQKA